MEFPTGIVTLAFTDIQGSSRLSETLREAFEPSREAHFRLLRDSATRWSGVEVGTAGDALFLVFARASDAAQWAVDAQKAIQAFAWPQDVGALRVRIGLHAGEPYFRDEGSKPDYFGPAVNRAARIEAAAHGGQILVSDATRMLAVPDLPAAITFLDMGTHRLKDVGEERLWQIVAPGLDLEFPALRTLDPARHNLPLPSAPLVGRERETADWQARLTGKLPTSSSTPSDASLPLPPRTRLLTVTGFGGMGKTRAALHLAEQCVERFEHGVCWVELEEARSPDEFHLKVAQQLRFDIDATRKLQEQIAAFLREREMLLVLDNSEQLQGAANAVNALLQSAPRLAVLVTSRRALDLRAETTVELRPLPIGDAERLFVERARQVRDDFALTPGNAADVTELCRRLEGIPLALVLAAARMTGMTPRDMLPRLAERFRLLQSRSPELPPRQRALRGTVDWSHDLLAQDEQEVFAQLGVFAGGFTLTDAEAVCEGFDVFESVFELRRHSFFSVETDAQTQQDRFGMLESLRTYAQEKLNARPDADAVRRRHAEHFARVGSERMAQFRQAGETDALRELTRNLANLRSGLEWARNAGATETYARLALLVGITLARNGYRAQAVAPIQEGLDALADAQDVHADVRLELLLERAGLHLELNEAGEAQQRAEQARDLADAQGDRRQQGRSENLLGRAAYAQNDFETARQCYARALERAAAGAYPTLEGIARNNLALVERRDPNGSREQAQAHLEQALILRRAQNDRRGQAETLTNLGILAFERKDWDAAWNFYAQSLELERSLEHVFGVATTLSDMGEVACEQGESRRACRLFAVSERLLRDLNSHLSPFVSEYLAQSAVQCACAQEHFQAEIRGLSLEPMLDYALRT